MTGMRKRRIVDGNLRRAADGRVAVAAEHIVDSYDVREKERVEFAPLEDLREVNPGVEIGVTMSLVVRVRPQPRGLMNHAVHVERVEEDALAVSGHSWLRRHICWVRFG